MKVSDKDVMVAIAPFYLVKLMFQTRKTKAVKWPRTTFYPLEQEYLNIKNLVTISRVSRLGGVVFSVLPLDSKVEGLSPAKAMDF
jgi:hypothetical protein